MLVHLKNQTLIVRGARQVGKTSFILNALNDLTDYKKIFLNLMRSGDSNINGIKYHGRIFFGQSPQGEDFIKNLESKMGPLAQAGNIIVFIDEVDRHPLVMEAIQAFADLPSNIKIICSGSNMENIKVENAATGRKKYFDLYPVTFEEFLRAHDPELFNTYINIQIDAGSITDHLHARLGDKYNIHLRLGGMPKILDAWLDPPAQPQGIPEISSDIVATIEENIKTVLTKKENLYEYEDVLRKIAMLSMNTLKFSRLQVQHAGRAEAKRLVTKSVGARVAHKIRLFDDKSDLSKYILFDSGIVNYLLNGSGLLENKLTGNHGAIMHETFLGTQIIAGSISRDDLLYWKAGNVAELEYMLRYKGGLAGIDVKSTNGPSRSLDSFAINEPDAGCIIKVGNYKPFINRQYVAKLPNQEKQARTTSITLPHYMAGQIQEIIKSLPSG